MAHIIVDSRESRSGLATLLEQLGAEVTSEELESGDFVLAEGLAVERKTATDFVISILDRRLFSQAPILKRSYTRPFIIVEGNVFDTRSAIEPAAILGAISYLAVMESIPVLTTVNTRQTAELMMTMHRHAVEGLGYDIAFRGGKPKDRSPQAQYLVEGLPGIGATGAKKLLNHFGSPLAVFTASPDELKQLHGIGSKTIATMHEVLGFDTRQV